MIEDARSAGELNHEDTARFIVDLFHRIIIHHALWFNEVKHQMGMEKALEILQTASRKSYDIQMKHLGNLLGFEMKDGIPSSLLAMNEDDLIEPERTGCQELAG